MLFRFSKVEAISNAFVSVQKEQIVTKGFKVATQIPRGRLRVTGLKQDALAPSRSPHLDQGTGVTCEGPESGVRIEESKRRIHGGETSRRSLGISTADMKGEMVI